MGAKDSKRACLSYEDAVKRVSDVELKRVCEAFKRLSGGGQLMSQNAFTQHVLGEGVPHTVAGSLYSACGGSNRGIALRDLVCGLVLLTKGSHEEKIRFLWTLYCNDSGTHICRSDFQRALQLEGAATPHSLPPSLFGAGQERASYEEFRAWISHNVCATVLSRWLLTEPCVSLSTAELDTPTFYQTLAGVTHLEETDICDLEKCFWVLQASASSGQLDLPCVSALVSPPVPASACPGLFHALDVNRDGHIDFKELCCGVSAACRGPIAERVKFCFKMFDMDRDGKLNDAELRHMLEVLTFVAKDHQINGTQQQPVDLVQTVSDLESARDTLAGHLSEVQLNEADDVYKYLGQEEFVMWGVPAASLVHPMLELLFQVCHVSLGLRPRCRHHEHDIVRGWLDREEKRGYRVGQFWYLVSSDWWRSWLAYTSAATHGSTGGQCPGCGQRAPSPAVSASADRSVEEGIACDESFTSNSTESMGDLLKGNLGGGDTCSIASSSGVSSSSGSGSGQTSVTRRNGYASPGPIDNAGLVAEPQCKVVTLTGEGGRLRRDRPLVQHRDFELLPDSLWKALAHWYGGPLPLPRQVIKPPGADDVDLELYPLNLRILRHQAQNQPNNQQTPNTWGSVVGGYGAAALSSAGLTAPPPMSPRRYLAHTAAFSRLATVGQVLDFLSQRLGLRTDDLRLWHVMESLTSPLLLLDDDRATLQDVGLKDGDQVLLEVRNADLTWPEELGALVAGARQQERAQAIALPAGATGLHNLGNTCFMNAALQAVSNTKPLTMYFRRDARLCELNQSNPLGTRGQVARRYAELCRELWTGTARSVAPLKLRWCVARHAPHLGGGGQHDSQELLAWLLDALHEDLNRVTGKRYTELSDSAGRPDAVVAAEAWKQHLARDHSVITDLFYGQLKSKVTCQTCGHESVRFDAFNVLSLPLPMDSYTLCEVLVVKLDGSVPTRYGIRLNSEARYSELKERLQRLCNVPAHRLILAEVADSQIRQVLGDARRVSAATALELLAYELGEAAETIDLGSETPPCSVTAVVAVNGAAPGSPRPAARSPEVSNTSALCMPNLLCFKTATGGRRSIDQPLPLRPSIHLRRNSSPTRSNDLFTSGPGYVTAVHRKSVRQDAYFVAQHRTRPVLFGVPLLLACGSTTTCQDLYEAVWTQVTRLLSPLPQSDQTNHAQDCDDSLGYEFPFTLRAVSAGGQTCALCSWTKFCRGCALPCGPDLVYEVCEAAEAMTNTPCNRMPKLCIAIDWDPTALHLRYQSCRERTWLEHESVATCRRQHTEPVDLDHCLRAFTSEESLETRYHCSTCQDKQPATKKLQIWRLPPILIIHLKRFDYVNSKWVKTHKVVNFPFKDFDPTEYLASVPQETILRHRQLRAQQTHPPTLHEDNATGDDEDDYHETTVKTNRRRDRLESTSLLRTPVLDENLEDFHMHHLKEGQDPFDLKYQLYAVVSHSGMLNGGHYVSYACNPNGNWYCYNDSSCREVNSELTPLQANSAESKPKMDTSSAYMLFYERCGLDYSPYLPDVPPGNAGGPLEAVELDESESELRKQLCNLS